MVRLIAIVLVIGGVLGYWYWTTTPQYSVMQIHTAIKQHDLQAFQKYVDIDSLASSMVDDLLAKPVQKALGPGIVGELIGFGLGAFLKPPLVASMKAQITEYVEGGSDSPAAYSDSRTRKGRASSFKGIPAQLGFTQGVFKGVEYVRTEGKVSLVGLKLYNEKFACDLVLELKLENAGGYWRLVELSNLQNFMGKIVGLQLQRSQETESVLPGTQGRLGSLCGLGASS